MKKISALTTALLSVLVVSASLSTSANEGAAARVGDFALFDQLGYFHQASYYNNHQAIAFLVQANGSKATEKALPAFQSLAAGNQEKIKFFMINPMGNQSRDAVKQQAEKYATEIPVLIDHMQLVSEAMGIDHSGEALLFDPKSFKVIYRGDVAGLGKAINNVVAGEAVTTAFVKTKGDSVSYPALAMHSKTPPSYSKNVAPILAENCARCHREGGIAPFAMNSYTMVQGWAPMIREVVMTKRMPPGQIDPHVGEFINSYTLTPEQSQTLVHWVDNGAKKDGDTDPLAQLTWPESKWAFGEPDLIIKVPPQEVPATGVLDYRQVVVPIDIDRDRWVRASQYVAGDRTVLHHTLNRMIAPGADPRRSGGFLGGGDPDAPSITAYIPGAEPYLEPPNTGGLLRKGSKIGLQLHYTTTGKATVDESEIGVWFYPDDQVPQERMSGQCACIFPRGWTNIPPYEADHEMTQTVVLPKDAHLYTMLPHMHFRGKRMRFYAEYPDGNKEELINIAKYNYAWQIAYQLKQPKFLPAGTKLIAVGAFDNSTQNPANPDPARSVPWGQQSWDEMFFGAMTWKFVDQSESEKVVSQ